MGHVHRKSWCLLAIVAYLAGGTYFAEIKHSRPSNTRLHATPTRPPLKPPLGFYKLACKAAAELGVDVKDYLSNIKMLACDFKNSPEINREKFQTALRTAMVGKDFTLVLMYKSLGKIQMANHAVQEVENEGNSNLTVLNLNALDLRAPKYLLREIFRTFISKSPWDFDFQRVIKRLVGSAAEEFAGWSGLTPTAEVPCTHQAMNLMDAVFESNQKIQTLTELTAEIARRGNDTCIFVEYADFALPGEDETQAQLTLQDLVMLAKTRRASVVLISSEYSYPFRLQRAGMNLTDIQSIMLANEIPKEEMVEVMVTRWKMSQELAEQFYLYFGGDIWLCQLALDQLQNRGEDFDPRHCDLLGVETCADIPDARKHLQNMADQGWSPVYSLEDAAAELIARRFLGGIVPSGAKIFDGPKDMWTGEHEYALVCEGTYMRWSIAEHLEREASMPNMSTSASQLKAVWVRRLREGDGGRFVLCGAAVRIIDEIANIDDLKQAIKMEKPETVNTEIEIYLQQKDGSWTRQDEEEAPLERIASKLNCYGYFPRPWRSL